jgi:UDP-N-acetyl-D-glucosamine dehydrogenase
MKNKYLERLIKDIDQRKITVSIIGLGYVGLPLALRFLEERFNVIGIDLDKNKIKNIQSGKSYISHISNEKIKKANKCKFTVSTTYSIIKNSEAIIICVPTPLGNHREPDLTYINDSLKNILPYISKGKVVILESTTYPGTTEETILSKVEKEGYQVGDNFFIGYSPEREDPGNDKYKTKNIPKVVSGATKNCLTLVNKLYSTIIDETVPVSSTRVAEMTKLLENIHRAINISLVNELKIVCDKMNIDIFEVIDAAATKPFGFTPFYPGPGLGGHCIPIDPFYLSWKAKELGISTRFIELAGEINSNIPDYVVSKLVKSLNNNQKSIMKSKILIVGLAYKKNVDDLRESPSFAIINLLIDYGAKIYTHDPLVRMSSIKSQSFYKQIINCKFLNSRNLQSFDAVIIVTNHDKVNYELIKSNSKLIIDTRGVYKTTKNIVRA